LIYDSAGIRSLLGLLLATSAFLSLCKAALQSFSRPRFLASAESEAKRDRLRKDLDAAESMTLTVAALDLLADGVFVAISTAVFGFGIEAWQRFTIALVASLTVVLVVGELLPGMLGRVRPERIVELTLPILRVISFVSAPFRAPFAALERLLERVAPQDADSESRSRHMTEEILSVVDEGERNGTLGEEERDMIEGIVELGDVDVREIMTPRTKMVSIEVSTGMDEVKKVIQETGHSRLPVYKKNRDNILGVLYAKDLVGREHEASRLPEIMRNAYFIPESKGVDELLKDFRANKLHMAVVVDEYGGTAGIVTMEDILEEVVGEIIDEYDAEQDVMIRSLGKSVAEVNARARIDQVNETLDLNLPETEEFSTIGGFIFSVLGRIPKPGETVRYGRAAMTVIDADERKINKLKIELKPEEPE
jgi:putative hemolysin